MDKIDGVKVVDSEEEMVKLIRSGISFAHFEYGTSMSPLLESGEYVIIDPISSMDDVKQGDIVFCRLHNSDNYMTHMVWIKNSATNECLIGSTNGDIYGWSSEILGVGRRTKNRIIEN